MPNWLPDWKTSLNEAFATYVKTPLETKANELNSKLEQAAQQFQTQINQKSHEFKQSNKAFQQAIITILFASFCVAIVAITCKND